LILKRLIIGKIYESENWPAKGNINKSIEVLKEGHEIFPKNYEILKKLVELLMCEKEYEEAYKYATEGQLLQKNDSTFVSAIGIFYYINKVFYLRVLKP